MLTGKGSVVSNMPLNYARMPDGGVLEISWEDWRDYLILSPHVDSLTDVLRYWRHATVSGRSVICI